MLAEASLVKSADSECDKGKPQAEKVDNTQLGGAPLVGNSPTSTPEIVCCMKILFSIPGNSPPEHMVVDILQSGQRD